MRGSSQSVSSRARRLALPIRLRLTLWYVALLAAILLAFCAYLYLSLSHSLSNELDATMAAVATQMQATVDNENGRPRLGTDSTQLAPDVIVALYDRSGRVLMDGSPPWSPSTLIATRTRAASGEAAFSTAHSPSSRTWRVLAMPVRESGRTIGVLEVGCPQGKTEAALRGLLVLMALAVPAILLLAAGGGLFLAQRALSPIDRITRLAQRIGAEDLSRRLDLPPSRDEVGRLAATFDDMLVRLDRAFQRQRQFVADASQEALEHELVSLDELAHEVAVQLAPLAAARGLRLEVSRAEPAVVAGDQTCLLQLLLNLADNALKYTPAGGSVTIGVGREAGWATLVVADTGIGIAAEHLSHLFERFYRVDKARSRVEGGSGLGLAICDWIARVHGGRIEVTSVPGQGSTFTVYLPLAAKP